MAGTEITSAQLREAAEVIASLQANPNASQNFLPNLQGCVSQADLRAFLAKTEKSDSYFDSTGQQHILNPEVKEAIATLADPANRAKFLSLTGLVLENHDPLGRLSPADIQTIVQKLDPKKETGWFSYLPSFNDLIGEGQQHFNARFRTPNNEFLNLVAYQADGRYDKLGKTRNRDWYPPSGADENITSDKMQEYAKNKLDEENKKNGTNYQDLDPLPDIDRAQIDTQGENQFVSTEPNSMAGLFTAATAGTLVSGLLAWFEHAKGPFLPERLKWPVIAISGMVAGLAGWVAGQQYHPTPRESAG